MDPPLSLDVPGTGRGDPGARNSMPAHRRSSCRARAPLPAHEAMGGVFGCAVGLDLRRVVRDFAAGLRWPSWCVDSARGRACGCGRAGGRRATLVPAGDPHGIQPAAELLPERLEFKRVPHEAPLLPVTADAAARARGGGTPVRHSQQQTSAGDKPVTHVSSNCNRPTPPCFWRTATPLDTSGPGNNHYTSIMIIA